jgi:transcriptional regulator with XRE-family HTH domain
MRKNISNTTERIAIGANIGHWRRLKGLKQEDLAVRAGISPTAMSHIENGESDISFSRIEDIAHALEVEVQQLLNNPQHIFNLQNSHQSNAVVYGNSTQTNIDKQFFEKLMLMLENMTSYFMKNEKSA